MASQPSSKRLFDFLFSLLCLVLLSPLLLLLALAVALESPGGPFFVQTRVGRRGRLFRIYKFRSMHPHPIDYAHLQEVTPRDPHLTRLGLLLRRTRLDELPQLLNILKGEMSFVGPRPTIPHQVECYTPFERRRLDVRPGLTGLAQASGNTALPWSERILLDVWYVDHSSLQLDLRILICTWMLVFSGREPGPAASPGLPSLLEARRDTVGSRQGLEAGQ